jgi:hypothetical protein
VFVKLNSSADPDPPSHRYLLSGDNSLKDYACDFIIFVSSFIAKHVTEEQAYISVERRIEYLFTSILDQAIQHASKDKVVSEVLNERLNLICNHLIKKPDLECFYDITEEAFKDALIKIVESVFYRVLENSKENNSSDESLNKLKVSLDLLVNLVYLDFRKATNSFNDSGVVIAGFGEEEIYPALATVSFEQLYWMKRLKHTPIDSKHVTPQQNVIIETYAQNESIINFTNGINPEFQEFIYDSIIGAVFQISQELYKQMLDYATLREMDISGIEKLRDEFNSKVFKSIRALLGEIDTYKEAKFIEPFKSAISFLPKDEMAAAAKALVELSGLSHKVSTKIESVGGPVDVAVITKGDGLVWIERKHYFRPELNPRFAVNSLRGRGGHHEA